MEKSSCITSVNFGRSALVKHKKKRERKCPTACTPLCLVVVKLIQTARMVVFTGL